jgi:glutathione S-transferase
MKHTLNVAGSLLTSTLNLWRGTHVMEEGKQAKQTLQLYDMESCPYCRLVREALTELDLDVMIYPCPKGGKRFRKVVKEKGGKLQFPFLIDPNTNTEMYESLDIINYLFKIYGPGSTPLRWKLGTVQTATSMLATFSRGLKGFRKKNSKVPKQPLELYSFESSPYARPVREALCELEIPYLIRNIGKNAAADYIIPAIRSRFFSDIPASSKKRQELMKRGGKLSVPFLVDPNTGVEMYESKAIKLYLRQTYAL